jgi:hypothetical protein
MVTVLVFFGASAEVDTLCLGTSVAVLVLVGPGKALGERVWATVTVTPAGSEDVVDEGA